MDGSQECRVHAHKFRAPWPRLAIPASVFALPREAELWSGPPGWGAENRLKLRAIRINHVVGELLARMRSMVPIAKLVWLGLENASSPSWPAR